MTVVLELETFEKLTAVQLKTEVIVRDDAMSLSEAGS